ncbi:MAG: YigZ family protein [Thermoanaerobaculia bacterium]|nr:YigZ family protein [Thermoanaerobaculia bacterium]
MGDHAYRTVAGAVRAEIVERSSRFLALVAPVGDEAEARATIDACRSRSPGATHHCWAWRLGDGPRERSSDAGEPSGTAGEPMLRVLRGAEIEQVVAVVSRWFGGVKLGRGGLARTYAAAVATALGEARVVTLQAVAEIAVAIPYETLGAVKSALGRQVGRVVQERYGDSAVAWTLRLPRADLERMTETLKALGVAPTLADRNG